MFAFVPSAASLLARPPAASAQDAHPRAPHAPSSAVAHAASARAPPRVARAPASAPAPLARPVTVVWFRDDLRIHDHPALHEAVRRGDRVAALVLHTGRRADATFWRAAALDLRARLRALGCELHVRAADGGSPDAVAATVLQFAADARASRLHFHRAFDKRDVDAERAVVAAARRRGLAVLSRWAGALRDPDRLPFAIASAPEDCDEFGRAVGHLAVDAPLSAPQKVPGVRGLEPGWAAFDAAPQQGGQKTAAGPGGETGALARVRDYCAGRSLVAATPGCSGRTIDTKFARLGPFLAAGCVSPRRVWAEVVASVSERSVRRFCAELELVLRDFVRVTTLKQGGVCPA